MTVHGVSRQYAHALFDVAEKNGTVARVNQDLAAFAALVKTHADLSRVLTSPAVPMSRKRALVDGLVAAAGSVTPEVRRLLDLLADRDRLALVEDVLAAFAERAMAADRVMRAELTTAVPLDDAARQNLVDALGRAVGRQVTVTERVDPAIIGGVIAKVGSLVFDGSVTRQLERLRATLASGG